MSNVLNSPIIKTQIAGNAINATVEQNKIEAEIFGGQKSFYTNAAWGEITGNIANQADLQVALGLKANTADLATVAFTGAYSDLIGKPTLLSQFTNDVGFITNLSGFTTNNLAEGGSNLYYTQTRFNSAFGAKTTTDLVEGSNLYFTNARADARVALQKGAANGIAPLGSDSKIANIYLPPLAITDVFVVSSQAAMLALDAQVGDVAIRTDVSKSFILAATPPSTLGNWQELLSPPNAVLSVNGQTGAVSLTTSNIAEGSNLYFTNSRAVTALTGENISIFNNNAGYINGSGNTTGNAGTVTTINGLIAHGTNITITGSGTSGSPYVINSSGGGGTPAGTTGAVQYNNAGAFAGDVTIQKIDAANKFTGFQQTSPQAVNHVTSDNAQTVATLAYATTTLYQFLLPTPPFSVNYNEVQPDIAQPSISAYATNFGSGGYNSGDVVDYRVTAGYDNGTTIVWGVASNLISGITDFGSGVFDIFVSLGAVSGQNLNVNVWSLSRQINGAGFNDYQRFTGSSFIENNTGWNSGSDSFTYADDFLANGSSYGTYWYSSLVAPDSTVIISNTSTYVMFTDSNSGNAYKLQASITGGDPEYRLDWNGTNHYYGSSTSPVLSPSSLISGAAVVTPNVYGHIADGSAWNKTYDYYNYNPSLGLYSATPISTTTTDPNDGLNYYAVCTFSGQTTTAKIIRDSLNSITSTTSPIYDGGITSWSGNTTVTPTTGYAPAAIWESHGSSITDKAGMISRSLDGEYSRFDFQNSSGTRKGYIENTSAGTSLVGSSGAYIKLGTSNDITLSSNSLAITAYTGSIGASGVYPFAWSVYGISVNSASSGYYAGLEVQALSNSYITAAFKRLSGQTNYLTVWLDPSNTILSDIDYLGRFNCAASTASTIAGWDSSKNLVSLSTATYPSLTELSYVKGVTSAIQTQLNSKGTFTLPSLTSGSILFSNGTTIAQNNSKLFWDNPNEYLCIGTNSGTHPLTFARSVGEKISLYTVSSSAKDFYGFSVAAGELQLQAPSSGGQVSIYGGTTEMLRISAGGGGFINLFNSSGQSFWMYKNGNNRYGFGVASYEARMFFPSDAVQTIGTISTSNGTTYTEKVRIDNSGKVGFGTASPAYTVDVAGDINTSGTYRAGGVAGITTTVTTASLVGKTITITKGIITGFA